MVRNLLSLLTVRQNSILSGAVVIMTTVMLGKILGLVRDRLLAHVFPPEQTEIFFAAFRMPDMLFQIFILGALAVAFIPVFTESLEHHGKEEAFDMARAVLNNALFIFFTGTVLLYIFAEPLTRILIVPGFDAAKQQQVVALTRIILIGQLILTVGSFFIGLLQSFQRFIIPSLAPVFYNLGIILGIVFFSRSLGIMAPAIGVVIGALFHVGIQLPLVLSLGFRLKFPPKFFHPGVKEIIRLISFRTIGLAAEQINETIGTNLASFASVGSISFLTYAQHLQLVPVSLFGASLAQAALPILSSEKARGRLEEFKVTLLTTMHQIFFLTLPATAILIVIRIPVVRLVFGASQFNWDATVLTGATVAYLAIGLSAQAIALLLVRGFYALKDTKTPVLASLVSVLINVLLSVSFVRFFNLDVWSLGAANSVAIIIYAVLLFATLHFKIGKFDLKQAFIPFLKMLMATVIMGACLYIPIKLLDQVVFDTTKTINLLVLTSIASVFALSIYILLVWFLKVRELQTYVELFKKFAKFQNKLKANEIIDTEGKPL